MAMSAKVKCIAKSVEARLITPNFCEARDSVPQWIRRLFIIVIIIFILYYAQGMATKLSFIRNLCETSQY